MGTLKPSTSPACSTLKVRLSNAPFWRSAPCGVTKTNVWMLTSASFGQLWCLPDRLVHPWRNEHFEQDYHFVSSSNCKSRLHCLVKKKKKSHTKESHETQHLPHTLQGENDLVRTFVLTEPETVFLFFFESRLFRTDGLAQKQNFHAVFVSIESNPRYWTPGLAWMNGYWPSWMLRIQTLCLLSFRIFSK